MKNRISILIFTTLLSVISAYGCETTIQIAGDSTVQTYVGEHGKKQQGWGQALGQFFGSNVATKNYAVSGKSTKTFKRNWGNVMKNTAKGDVVMIQFGHNDSHKLGRRESTNAETDYKDNLIAYVKSVKKKGAIPILVTPPYRRSFDEKGKLLPYISNKGIGPSNLAPFAKSMRLVAKQENVILVDLFARSGELFQSLGDERVVPLFCSPTDRAHFSPYGAKVMAKLIVLELQKQKKDHKLAELIDSKALSDFQIKGYKSQK